MSRISYLVFIDTARGGTVSLCKCRVAPWPTGRSAALEGGRFRRGPISKGPYCVMPPAVSGIDFGLTGRGVCGRRHVSADDGDGGENRGREADAPTDDGG